MRWFFHAATGQPAQFEVMSWVEGGRAPEAEWQAPAACFVQAPPGGGHGHRKEEEDMEEAASGVDPVRLRDAAMMRHNVLVTG